MTRSIRNILAVTAAAGVISMAWSSIASAHVVVKPAEVKPAAFQSFSVGVPTEGASPTVEVRLSVPEGVKYVTPNVKPGWKIEVIKDGEGEEAKVKQIVWSGGEVPVGQRDDFGFSLQAPAEATTLQWKAYQTYADGKVVSWDQSPKAEHADEEGGTSGPYSETKVTETETATDAAKTSGNTKSDTNSTVALLLAALSVVISVVALTRGNTKKSA